MQKTREGTPAMPGLQRFTAGPLMPLALILLVGIIAYSNSFGVPFVIDDEGSILENPVVKDLSSFLFDGAGFRYNARRFVGYLTFAVNYRLGGVEVAGYHLVNLAVHLSNGLLLYALLMLTMRTPLFSASPPGDGEAPQLRQGRTLVPLFAALLFVAHPIQTQAVTYVVQRLASLATLFYLASVCCYAAARLRQQEEGSLLAARALPLWLLSAAAGGLALFTKEISFTLPLALILYEFSFFGAGRRKVVAVLVAGAGLALAAACALHLTGEGGLAARLDLLTRETQSISRKEYLFTQFSVLVTYLRLVFLPVGQNLDYDYPVYHSLFTPRVLVCFVLLALLLLLALYLYRGRRGEADPWRRLAGFGILWFFLTISIESGVIPIRDLIFEHRVYLPSVGLFSALAAFALFLSRRLKGRGVAVCGGVLVVVLAALTFQRNLVWGSSVALWRDCVEKSPRKLRPRNNLANALMAQGRAAEAVEQLKVALEIAPRDAAAIRNLGTAYEKLGGVEQAIELYRKALTSDPLNKYARYNLGIAYSKQGLAGEAIAEFLQAVTIDPQYAEAHNNLGVMYAATGKMQRAADEFRLAASLDPRSAEAHLNLGRALGEVGESRTALEELERAAALDPQNAEAYNCMGIVLARAGRRDEAAARFRKAAQLRPEDPRFTNNLYRLQLGGG